MPVSTRQQGVGPAKRLALAALSIGLACAERAATAYEDPDAAPIHYHQSVVHDAVAELQSDLDAGRERLDWHDRWGWLPSVLERLDLPTESQTLVFSKTSFQAPKISPHRPRALYYNDETYVGYVQRGRMLEVMSVDPVQGPIFYTLEQEQGDGPPRFVRDRGDCLACHLSQRTRGVPGLVVRSVFPDQRGHPLLSLGDEATDPSTPFEKRYGGWYVTGTCEVQHRGNALYADPNRSAPEATPQRSVRLGEDCDTDRYLTPHSDLVALMVLEHQAQMHNAITRASYEARRAAAYDAMWGELLEKPEGFAFEVSKRRLDSAAEELLECLLFCGEERLTGEVIGSSGFTESFQAAGKRDPSGRSLRDFDLKSRLFRYPCSYLIHSDSFAALPRPVLDRLVRRLAAVLAGEQADKRFDHLNESDRQAIGELLRETGAPLTL